MSSRHPKLHIPRRVSSVLAPPNELSSRQVSRERVPTPNSISDNHTAHSSSAASRTDDECSLPIQSNETAMSAERVVLSTITEAGAPQEDATDVSHLHVPRSDAHRFPDREVRQRSSSPLLGVSYNRSRGSVSPAPFHPKSKNPLRISESASALSSFYESPQSPPPVSSHETISTEPEHRDISSGHSAPAPPSPTSRSATDLYPPGDSMAPSQKENRTSKLRPMMDISKLFPKHRESSPRLLSPGRLTASPSPVSFISDEAGNKPAKFSGVKDSMSWRRGRQRWKRDEEQGRQQGRQQGWQMQLQRQEQERQAEEYAQQYQRRRVPKTFRMPTQNTWNRRPAAANWFDGPEGQISDDDGDSGVEIESEIHIREKSPADNYRCESTYSDTKSQAWSLPVDSTSGCSVDSNSTVRNAPSRSTVRADRNMRSSSSQIRSGTVRTPSTVDEGGRLSRTSSPKEPQPGATKRNYNKAAFGSSNLNEASVLCLSSDDEDEEENSTSKSGNRTFVRDSIATFDEGEICTAKAAVAATRRPSIRSVKPNDQNPTRPASSPQSLEFHLPGRRSKDSGSGRQTPDRRSRFLAVTKQEEYMLEVLRRNKGVVHPSLFNDSESNNSSDPEGNSINTSRRSQCSYNSDTSFLKLSPGVPPSHQISRNAAESRSLLSRRGATDCEPVNTDRPRGSFAHSDVTPSPSTGLTSPRTPTSLSASHRFSLQSPHPPPNFSPPPVPEQRRHSRTRTGSSNALAFDPNEEGGKEPSPDLPIWALGWNQELNTMAVAH